MAQSLPEPWLRGPLPDVHPLLMPVFHSFAQVREDLARHLSGIPEEQIWRDLPGGSLGFHLAHLAGSVDRLTSYLFQRHLSEAQLSALAGEAKGHATAEELQALIFGRLAAAEALLRTLQPKAVFEPRTVGRQHLPTNVLGLLVHICEHTQRHLGQCITLCHVLRVSA